jgi:ABC-type Fe3+/spermidine/putrescine transport system ATPase subunit
MDEPLGALDKKLRDQLQVEIKAIQQELGLTVIYVTHDQEEALVMSDRIAVMRNGLIEQFDTPRELFERPRTPFVADFLGAANFLPGRIEQHTDEHTLVRLDQTGGLLTARRRSLERAEPPAGAQRGAGVRARSMTMRRSVKRRPPSEAEGTHPVRRPSPG